MKHKVYNRDSNIRRYKMTEYEQLRKENDELQAKIEQQLRDINKTLDENIKLMQGK